MRLEVRWVADGRGALACFLIGRCEAPTTEEVVRLANDLRTRASVVPDHVVVEPVEVQDIDAVLEPFEVLPCGGIVALRRPVRIDRTSAGRLFAIARVDPWTAKGVGRGAWAHVLQTLERSATPVALSVLLVPGVLDGPQRAALEQVAGIYAERALPTTGSGIFGSGRSPDDVAHRAAADAGEWLHRLAHRTARLQVMVTSAAPIAQGLLAQVAEAIRPGAGGLDNLAVEWPDPPMADNAVVRHAELDDAWWISEPLPAGVPAVIARLRDLLDPAEVVVPFRIPPAPGTSITVVHLEHADSVQIGNHNVQGGTGNVTGSGHTIHQEQREGDRR
ncbi:hypothetical protein L1785_13600 [Antribacter sp. KLBMP9083]|uniref:Uncharacterized protein n=2 Tax=Antribacter soli TaxID=2910976 RepID=A0AA41QEL0_9MICO|nr:hypothetical protein [Antribacter soli]